MIHEKMHVGIGFATGRVSFQNVLRAYIYHLRESHFLVNEEIYLSLFVAYDPVYNNTKRSDYDNLSEEERSVFYQCTFLGPREIKDEIGRLVKIEAILEAEADGCLGNGYAVQRNIILCKAVEQKVDYLIFLDDDEYMLAVTQSNTAALWSGQLVLEEHIKFLQFSDITVGYHCGYLAPVPSMEFDGVLSEAGFHRFTDALSSDVLNWEDVCSQIQDGGITYADKQVLIDHRACLVEEQRGAKFISGGNLGINLTDPSRVLPFYNPPGARGEDSILSTSFRDYNVKKIPVYTFHDGFSFYGSLLKGVLPTELKKISLYDSRTVIERFYKACIGWVRYKPLYTYLTQPESYAAIIEQAAENLRETLPSVCAYFNDQRFMNIQTELQRYSKNMENHCRELRDMKKSWKKIMSKESEYNEALIREPAI